jgi:effector-binding domain-containing protein
MIESIGVETLAAQSVAVVRGKAHGHEIGEFVGAAYGEVVAALGAQEAGPTGPPLIIYALGAEGMDESGQAMVFTLAAGFPCAASFTASGRVEAATLPGGDAIVAVHVGAWPELGEAYAAVEAYFAEHGLSRAGDPWETYLDGPEADPHRTILTAPCR